MILSVAYIAPTLYEVLFINVVERIEVLLLISRITQALLFMKVQLFAFAIESCAMYNIAIPLQLVARILLKERLLLKDLMLASTVLFSKMVSCIVTFVDLI